MGVKAAIVTVPMARVAYPAINAPDFVSDFVPLRWLLHVTSADGTGRVFFSFDRVTDHGVLIMSGITFASDMLVLNQRFTRLWIRSVAATSDHVVSIVTES